MVERAHLAGAQHRRDRRGRHAPELIRCCGRGHWHLRCCRRRRPTVDRILVSTTASTISIAARSAASTGRCRLWLAPEAPSCCELGHRTCSRPTRATRSSSPAWSCARRRQSTTRAEAALGSGGLARLRGAGLDKRLRGHRPLRRDGRARADGRGGAARLGLGPKPAARYLDPRRGRGAAGAVVHRVHGHLRRSQRGPTTRLPSSCRAAAELAPEVRVLAIGRRLSSQGAR